MNPRIILLFVIAASQALVRAASAAPVSAARRFTVAFVVALSAVGNASAILLDRGPDMVYDSVLDITWTRDANLSGSLFTYDQAHAWADALVFAGFDDWRLPYASVSVGYGLAPTIHACTGLGGAEELACRDNEMGYMYYYNLAGTFGQNKTGDQTAVGGEVVVDISTFTYWSDTARDADFAWPFNFNNGGQGAGVGQDRDMQFSAWAVRSGDVGAAVPEPATLALLGIGLAGLAFSRRKRS